MLPEPPDWVLRATDRLGPLKGFLTLREEVDALLFELIAERRADASGRDDVLAMLLDARHEDGSEMSAQELRDELMTLLAAGHETTASSLAWAFERLAREPRVLARLAEEVRDGDDDAYLTATIQETLRRRPVIPNAAPRLIKEPIEIGGWTYPAGASLVVSSYLIHTDPEIYPDPLAFQPERFLDSPPGTYTWTPFGGGRRRCLGASFAMLEMQAVISAVLRTRDLHPLGGPEPARRRNISVRPGRGARVGLTGVRERATVAV
jgi:cytochrome P450